MKNPIYTAPVIVLRLCPIKYKKNGNVEIIKLALEKMYDEIARIEIDNIMEETRVKLNGLAPENYEIKRIPNKLAKTDKDLLSSLLARKIKADKLIILTNINQAEINYRTPEAKKLGRINVKEEPFPYSLSTEIEPFISPRRLLVIASPRPLPSTVLFLSISSLLNFSKRPLQRCIFI